MEMHCILRAIVIDNRLAINIQIAVRNNDSHATVNRGPPLTQRRSILAFLEQLTKHLDSNLLPTAFVPH